MQEPEKKLNTYAKVSGRQRDGLLRLMFFIYEHIVLSHGIAAITKRALVIRLPPGPEIAKAIGVAPATLWKIAKKLIAQEILQVNGIGRGTRYELRSPAAFLKLFEQTYLKMAGGNYYVPYMLPRKMRELSKEECVEQISKIISTSSERGEAAFALHTSLEQKNNFRIAYRSKEIELLVSPAALERVELDLRLTPILPVESVKPNRPLLLSADLIVFYNKVSEAMVHQCKEAEGMGQLSDIVNYFELKRYPRRGQESAEALFEDMLNSQSSKKEPREIA